MHLAARSKLRELCGVDKMTNRYMDGIEGSFASAKTPSIFGVCNKRLPECRALPICFAVSGQNTSIFAIVYALYATISLLKINWLELISLCSIIPMGITSLACVSSSTYSQLCQNMWDTIHGWSRLASEKEPNPHDWALVLCRKMNLF